MLIFASFLGTLIPQGFAFDYSLLWGTANKIFWGAMSLYAGGSAGVEVVRQVLLPAVIGRADFLQCFSESLPKEKDSAETSAKLDKNTAGVYNKETGVQP